jgi:hypothetical protein
LALVIIQLEELHTLLEHSGLSFGDTSPSEAVAIKFVAPPRHVSDSVTYHTASGGLLVIDVDDEGKAIGIEMT